MESKFEIINDKWISIISNSEFKALKIDSIQLIHSFQGRNCFYIKLWSSYLHSSGMAYVEFYYSNKEEELYESDLKSLKNLLFKM